MSDTPAAVLPPDAPVLVRVTRLTEDREEFVQDLEVPPGPDGVRLGREPRMAPRAAKYDPVRGADLVVEGDAFVSNHHATLRWHGGQLHVRRRTEPDAQGKTATNVIQVDEPGGGWATRDQFTVHAGGRFRIGRTVFTLAPTGPTDPPGPGELTLGASDLARVEFDAPAEQLAALAVLPGLVRPGADERVLADRLLDVLLRGVRRAAVAAVVGLDPGGGVQVLAARRRPGSDGVRLRPSRRLVTQALREFENRAHVAPAGLSSEASDSLALDGLTWAICVRLAGSREEGLYLGGGDEVAPRALDGDLKFATLAGDIFAGLRDRLALHRQTRVLEQLVSAPVRRAVRVRELDEVLARREFDVTVLFCDLRGFTRAVNAGRGDLMGTWDRLAGALDAMTDAITATDGVIGDFQGDAVMGFWGWPLPQADQVERAARAALQIRKEFVRFAATPAHPLHGTACGIGLAHGPAVAGKLGTFAQVKVGVFGPVVNRAARMETATKKLGVPILTDEAVYDRLAGLTFGRRRPVAPVTPKGFEAPVLVAELLPHVYEDGCTLTDEQCQAFEAALRKFRKGDWPGFLETARGLPDDGPTAFLSQYVQAARGADGRPPTGWDGGVSVAGDDAPPTTDHRTRP